MPAAASQTGPVEGAGVRPSAGLYKITNKCQTARHRSAGAARIAAFRSLAWVREGTLAGLARHLHLRLPAAIWIEACLGQGKDQRGVSRPITKFGERLGVEVVDGVLMPSAPLKSPPAGMPSAMNGP